MMPTWNKALHSLTREDVDAVSLKYMMGWHDLMACGYGFRPKGLNRVREMMGLAPLTKEMSFAYRMDYIQSHFSHEEIREAIFGYLRTARVGDTRWSGIEILDCRFGREYARAFRELLGSSEYRKLSEELRRMKLIETQVSRYGGVGLAGAETKAKAMATNMAVHGGLNVMDDVSVRKKVAETNRARYGGISPFSSNIVREKALRVKNPELWDAMRRYKQYGEKTGTVVESRFEFQAFCLLIARFGLDDVFCQYGIHPSDVRYPYNCDFYVKSLDLFIELHLHYCHGGHWYDPNNHDDVLRLENIRNAGHAGHYKALMKAWAGSDVVKREAAAQAGLKYLVFWGDGKCSAKYGLSDFELWFHDYDCDYAAFVADHPENTY